MTGTLTFALLSQTISLGEEAWQGRQFKAYNDVFVFAGMQIVRWLNLFGGGGVGPSI